MYDPAYEADYSFCPTECPYCEEIRVKRELAQCWLESIIKQLYSNAPLDLQDLEGDLDELCHYIGVKMIPGDLKICKIEEKKNINGRFITFYKE